MHEVAIGRPVRRSHGHVGFGDGDRVFHLRQHHRHAGAKHDAELPPCPSPCASNSLSILLRLILIAHIRSLSNLDGAADSNPHRW